MQKQKKQLIPTAALSALSYLLGSVPFSYLVARTRGVDLRTVGSGNIGSSNVLRSCGMKPFLAAVTLDIGKGAVVPLLARHAYNLPPGAVILTGTAAMAGHTFPIFMRFRGGKAVATSAGVLLAIFPPGTLIGAILWGVLLKTTRIASVSSLSAAAVVTTLALLRASQKKLDPAYAMFISSAGVAIVYLHRSNIQRLLQGRENRFEKFS